MYLLCIVLVLGGCVQSFPILYQNWQSYVIFPFISSFNFLKHYRHFPQLHLLIVMISHNR